MSRGPHFNFHVFVPAGHPAWNFIFFSLHLSKSHISQGPNQVLLHPLSPSSVSIAVQSVRETLPLADHGH